jgi:hypothetical protein
LFGKDKEKYNTSKDKSPGSSYNNLDDIGYHFEILSFSIKGESNFNVKRITLRSAVHGDYNISVLTNDGYYAHKFFNKNIVADSNASKSSTIVTFGFKSDTGILFIDDDKNNHYEIQLKFKRQIVILHHFLNFVYLSKNKITDKTIKEIQPKSYPEKIMLEKNNSELNESEEVLSTYYLRKRVKWNGDDEAVPISEKFTITNFRIIQDVWCYPVLFHKKPYVDIEELLSNSNINFTHDEYDDVFASNITTTKSSTGSSEGGINSSSFYGLGVNQELHSYVGMSEAKESGDIIFMSRGKKLCTWTNFVDPKGIVDMIKSAKSQFESQDEKIIEPVLSSSDDDPLKILKTRLAKGEITLEEFKEIKENLV